MIRFYQISASVLYLFLIVPEYGEDFTRLAPKPVPPLKAKAKAEPAQPKAVSKEKESNDLITPKLKGWVLVSDPDKIIKAGVDAQGVVYKDVKAPAEPELNILLTRYLNHELTLAQLNDLVKKMILFYRDHDRPVVDVIVPEQDVTNGVIQLIIIEGKVGEVTVVGNRWFSTHEIRGDIRLEAGDSISSRKLQNDLDWANANPFHSSDLIYRAGKNLGETDVVFNTVDRFPARPYIGYEDSGNQATGFDRYYAGVNWGDAFHLGLGQQMNYQYTTSGNGQSLRAHSGSYVIPLPWRHTLTFFGNYVDTKGRAEPFDNIEGRSYQISGRYNLPLPTYRSNELTLRESFSAGFDYKYNNNSLEFGGQSFQSTLYDVDQFVFSYNLNEKDPWGSTNLDEELYFSPGNLGGHNTDSYYEASHSQAQSNYIYDNIILERTTRLPADFSLILRGTVQKSDGNLVDSEQLGFGGYSTVRGYDEREVNADEGYITTVEIRTPSVSFGQWADCAEWNDQMQFLTFWDYGSASNHTPLARENPNIELSSVGVGFRYNISTYASVRFDYGFQLLETGFDHQHGSRANLGVTLSY